MFHSLYHVDLINSDHNHTILTKVARCLCYFQQRKFIDLQKRVIDLQVYYFMGL